ncbi:MAG TPA: hypothetical protein VGU25_18090 [Acidobacteriaceae bacterium]|nr:hypothetical protein [Acidobacteriaceae bacterium]
MISRWKWINAVAIIFVSFFTTVSVRAQDAQPCFDLASLQGNYTIIGTYGANVAIALAKRNIDGKGNLTGTFIVNEPLAGSTTGQRNIVSGTQVGTLTVNCDGTGVVTRVLTVGTTQTEQFDDFVITHAIMENGHLIATSVTDAQRTPSTIVAGGIFLTRVWTRIPSHGGQPWGGQR